MNPWLEKLRQLKSREEGVVPTIQPCKKQDDIYVEIDPSTLNESIEYFIKMNLALRVNSKLLDEDIYLISNESCKGMVPEGYVIYLPHEIRHLRSLNKEELKRIHAAKKIFGGTVICFN